MTQSLTRIIITVLVALVVSGPAWAGSDEITGKVWHSEEWSEPENDCCVIYRNKVSSLMEVRNFGREIS
jgi:hypothetical protein